MPRETWAAFRSARSPSPQHKVFCSTLLSAQYSLSADLEPSGIGCESTLKGCRDDWVCCYYSNFCILKLHFYGTHRVHNAVLDQTRAWAAQRDTAGTSRWGNIPHKDLCILSYFFWISSFPTHLLHNHHNSNAIYLTNGLLSVCQHAQTDWWIETNVTLTPTSHKKSKAKARQKTVIRTYKWNTRHKFWPFWAVLLRLLYSQWGDEMKWDETLLHILF